MEEEKKRKREIVILNLTILLLSAALIVQVLFGREGTLRKKSEGSHREVLIEEAARYRGADSSYVDNDTVFFYKNKEFMGKAVFVTLE